MTSRPSPVYTVGSPVRVVGDLCPIRTTVGLFGYVRRVWTPEENGGEPQTLWLSLLSLPTLDRKDDKAREARGDYQTTSAQAAPCDVVPLTNRAAIARVAKLRAAEEKRERKPSPVIDAIMADMETPAYHKREAKERAEVEAEQERIGDVFKLPGYVRRGDKSQFPAYSDPISQAVAEELGGYACRPSPVRETCTVTERARWGQALQHGERCSFWHPTPAIRALVKELDLDPFADEFNAALYKERQHVYTPADQLRAVAFELWNSGAVFLDIDAAKDAETNAERGDMNPTGYHIAFAFRRKLPKLPAPGRVACDW